MALRSAGAVCLGIRLPRPPDATSEPADSGLRGGKAYDTSSARDTRDTSHTSSAGDTGNTDDTDSNSTGGQEDQMTFTVEGPDSATGIYAHHVYQIEFHHINKASKAGRQRLAKTAGLNGLTICVVTMGKITSIAAAICSGQDQFCRESGRLEAMKLALQRCKPFRADIQQILEAYGLRGLKSAKSA